MRSIIPILALLLLIVPSAAGQSADEVADSAISAPQTARLHHDWQFDLQVGAWLPRLGGMVQYGPDSAGKISLEEGGFNLRDRETVYNGEITATYVDGWGIFLGAFDFSTATTGRIPSGGEFGFITIDPTESYSSSFEMASLAGEFQFELFHPVDEERSTAATGGTSMRLIGQLGLRYVSVEQTLQEVGAPIGEEVTADWLIPYAGLRLALEYWPRREWLPIHRAALDVSFGAGTAINDFGGLMWSIRAGLTIDVLTNAGFTIGYRLLELNLQDDSYTLDGGLQGLFISASLQF